MRFLITSGGTNVPIDDVRHIGNMSSGRFGREIGLAALRAGHDVDFLHAKGSMVPHIYPMPLNSTPVEFKDRIREMMDHATLFDGPNDYNAWDYTSYEDYTNKLHRRCEAVAPDVVILCAAVADYATEKHEGKLSSDRDGMAITLRRVPKVIQSVRMWVTDAYLVGFKLLVGSSADDREAAAKKQMQEAKSDMVVANDLNDIKKGRHTLYCYSEHGLMQLSNNGGDADMASKLIDKISFCRNAVTS